MPERHWIGPTGNWREAANWTMNGNDTNRIMGFDPAATPQDDNAFFAAWARIARPAPEPIRLSISANTIGDLYGTLMHACRIEARLSLEGVCLTGVGSPYRAALGGAEEIQFEGEAARAIVLPPDIQPGATIHTYPYGRTHTPNPSGPELVQRCRQALQDAGLIPHDTRGMEFSVRELIRKAIGGDNIPRETS